MLILLTWLLLNLKKLISCDLFSLAKKIIFIIFKQLLSLSICSLVSTIVQLVSHFKISIRLLVWKEGIFNMDELCTTCEYAF